MNATYNTDNTLTELPGPKPDSKDYTRVVHRPFGEVYCFADNKYYDDLKAYEAHLSTLRTIPCSPECRGLFEVGKTYEEGKDYEVRAYPIPPMQPTDPMYMVYPLPVKSEDPFVWTAEDEDKMWMEVIDSIPAQLLHSWKIDVIDELKTKYNISRK